MLMREAGALRVGFLSAGVYFDVAMLFLFYCFFFFFKQKTAYEM